MTGASNDIHRPSRANPLADNPLTTRADHQQAVRDLYEPLVPYRSPSGARVRLGSFGSVFEDRVRELEGFARPLYGIVPLTIGGGEFAHWDAFAGGLDAGTDPDAADFWGPVGTDTDQRMVEQAAIGLALAFCPERIWEPLSAAARDRVTDWLHGIYRHDPAPNNWQFFRVLVSLGLERVGRPVDDERLAASLDFLETCRLGDHWYKDGALGNVDYYIPFAFHTYGLMYVAANRLGLGDESRAAAYAERAVGFAADFDRWFGPDGAAIPFGRSLTYRFAMGGFWGSLAWAGVDGVDWATAKGHAMRHLRWWSEHPISDRDGVLAVGYAYDNRRLAEAYNSAGSPYWCMKYFGGLAAPADHPFWTADEAPAEPFPHPITLTEAGWVCDRDEHQAVALLGKAGLPISFMEQATAKYDKLVYSSAFGFSGEVDPAFGPATTDSTISLTDDDEQRRTRADVVAGGVEDGMAWSTFFPWPDVRVDTVTWGGTPWHGRLHRIRNERAVEVEEGGFAVAADPGGLGDDPTGGKSTVSTDAGVSMIVDPTGARESERRSLPVNANLHHPNTAVPLLVGRLEPGDHLLETLVFATPVANAEPGERPQTPAEARALLDRTADATAEPFPSARAIRAMMRGR